MSDEKDMLVEDMTEAQRRQGQEPTPSHNERLAVPLLERLEHKRRNWRSPPPIQIDAKPKHHDWKPAKTTHKGGIVRDPETREVRKLREVPEELGYMIKREPDTEDEQPLIKVSEHTLKFTERLSERVALLLSERERGPLGQPSWSERVMAIMATRHVKGYPKKRRSLELIQLCEESSETFGDWKKEPAKPVHFT